jgi:Kef-type K+ transport system membrane component KefB
MQISEQQDAWYLSPLIVLVLLFLVMGPFALPLLFRSRGFSAAAKIILTLLVLAYVSYLAYISYKVGMSWESNF